MQDRDVRERLDAAREDHVGVAQDDLIGGIADRLGGGGAGAVEGIGGHAGEQLGKQAHLPGDIGREHRGDHLTEDDLVDLPAVEVRPVEQLPGDVPGQGHGRHVAEDRPALGEGSTQTGDDRDPPIRSNVRHVASG